MKITSFGDLPSGIQMLATLGEVTYRGTADMKDEPENCVLIKVSDGKEHLISKQDFEKLGGIKKIRFSAPYRQE